MYYIYRITNKLNGKTYIGQHKYKDLSEDKYMGSGKYLWNAINRYGIENFEKEILVSNISTKEEINKLEIKYIKIERESNHGEYNISDGGGNPVLTGENNPLYGKPRSNEIKLKISNSCKGKRFSEEHRKNISKSLKGRTLSDAHKDNLSKSAKIANSGENNPMYGKHHSEESRHKISESRKFRIGKRYYNNGSECHLYIPGNEPKGYILGKLVKF